MAKNDSNFVGCILALCSSICAFCKRVQLLEYCNDAWPYTWILF